jgi:hypothetical protein
MECQLLETCGFFKKYGKTWHLACQELILRYCKGSDTKNCRRLEYRNAYGNPPEDEMMPSGMMMKYE